MSVFKLPETSNFDPLNGNGRSRTRGVLAAADLNELLDIGDFARHGDGIDAIR
jgi:hypothetical protein